MEDLLSKCAEQAPALVVLVILVVVFIRDRRKGSEQSDRAFKQRDDTIKEIARESNLCHERSAACIAAAAKVIEQNTATLQEMQRASHAPQRQGAIGP